MGLDFNLTEALTGHEAPAHVLLIAGIKDPAQQLVVKEAFASSLRGIWVGCAVVAGCAVLCSAFVKGRVLSVVHVETKTGIREKESVPLREEMS